MCRGVGMEDRSYVEVGEGTARWVRVRMMEGWEGEGGSMSLDSVSR